MEKYTEHKQDQTLNEAEESKNSFDEKALIGDRHRLQYNLLDYSSRVPAFDRLHCSDFHIHEERSFPAHDGEDNGIHYYCCDLELAFAAVI